MGQNADSQLSEIYGDWFFLPADQVFYKIIVSLLVCIDEHAQSTQNKFPISFAIKKIMQWKCEGWSWFFAYR